MSVRTATGGKADYAAGSGTTYTNIPEIRKWNLSINPESKTYASSSTAGAKKRIGGTDDFKLTIDFYVDRSTSGVSLDTALGIKPKSTGTIKAYEDASNFWSLPVYFEDISYDVDIESGSIIGGTITCSGNGVITYPTI